MNIPSNPTPWWFKMLVLVCALPVLAYPFLLRDAPADGMAHTLTVLYPAYVIASAICALMCYGRRPEVSWILVVLLVLTDAAMWILVNEPAAATAL